MLLFLNGSTKLGVFLPLEIVLHILASALCRLEPSSPLALKEHKGCRNKSHNTNCCKDHSTGGR